MADSGAALSYGIMSRPAPQAAAEEQARTTVQGGEPTREQAAS